MNINKLLIIFQKLAASPKLNKMSGENTGTIGKAGRGGK